MLMNFSMRLVVLFCFTLLGPKSLNHSHQISETFLPISLIKGALCSFYRIKTQNFNIHNINEVIILTQEIFIFPVSEETSFSQRIIREHWEHLLKLKRWQGPPHIQAYKNQSKKIFLS